MEIIYNKTRKYIIILEKVWDFYLRFIFSKTYIDFLEKNWKTPEDIYKKESEYFKHNLKSDTYVLFTSKDCNDFNFLKEENYEDLDKAILYSYIDNKFQIFNHFFSEKKSN